MGISNQGGVGAGHKSLEDAIEEQRYTLELLPEISYILICPDFKGKECWWIEKKEGIAALHADKILREFNGTFRKPNPGMLNAAIKGCGREEHRSNYWYVGDREEDKLAAAAAGVNFCDAEMWRNRFRPGMHEMDNTTLQLIEFLEGIRL